MLVQYEDPNQPPTLTSAWSWQDSQGSWLLITLAWIGVLVGVAGALYWAHLSVLGALFGTADWPGYVWLALTAAGAALIAPVLWPFLEDRRPRISRFVLIVGIISWIVTSASGTLYLMGKPQMTVASLATAPLRDIEAALSKDYRSVIDAEHDCSVGIGRGCAWIDSRSGGQAARIRISQYNAELERRRTAKPQAQPPGAIRAIMTLRQRLLLFATVAFGGCVALAMVWGGAEALKGMYNEPGHLLPGASLPGVGLPGGEGSPLDIAFEQWARDSLEQARGERASVANMYAHYRGYCMRRGFPAYASDSAFGRALDRQPDRSNPGDLGGPMVRYGAYPIKTGGKMEYIGVRIRPDEILDEIEAA